MISLVGGNAKNDKTMKFCYLDESGTGHEPFAVMVGIIVDSHRMHLTKKDWADLLLKLSRKFERIPRPLGRG